jgi:hypothetical protein
MNRAGLLLLFLLVPLAGCANVADGDLLTGRDMPSQGPMIALPPQAGHVVGVVESRDGSKITQTIALAADPSTAGQNQLVVVTKPGAIAPRISSDAIAAEMAKSLPGVTMSIANTLNRNAFGPFGYALGRTGDQTCLYAWQSVGSSDAAAVSIFSAARRTLSLRLRLCRSRVSPSALVAVMQGLGPGGGGGVLVPPAYASMDALAAASGVGTMASAPVLAQPAMADALSPGEPPSRPRRTSRPAPAPATAVPPAAPQALAPAVPLPQASQASAQTQTQVASPAPAAAVPPPMPSLPATVQPPPAAPLAGMPVVPLPPP